MNRCHRPLGLLILLLAVVGGPAGAAIITPPQGRLWLDPEADPTPISVATGESFDVIVRLDATGAPGAIPGLYGGQFVIDFDPAQLRYDAFSLAPGISFFSAPATGSAGGRQTVTIGFDNGTGNGAAIGTFRFTALGAPGSLATIGLADADDFFGTFISYVPSYQPFYPAFDGTQVNIVPLPAAGWLLVSAIASVAARRRLAVARR
jgi:hypothetical protein